jgi:hypothetical protein
MEKEKGLTKGHLYQKKKNNKGRNRKGGMRGLPFSPLDPPFTNSNLPLRVTDPVLVPYISSSSMITKSPFKMWMDGPGLWPHPHTRQTFLSTWSAMFHP